MSALQQPWPCGHPGGRWQVAALGKSKAIALGSALNLMKGACRQAEAEAVRQGLRAAGRSDSGEIYGAS